MASTLSTKEIYQFYFDKKDIINAEFKCLGETQKYDAKGQKYLDILWDETLKYLNAYAIALTTAENSECLNSDEAVIDTTNGARKMCIMDRRDMKIMVKNIYQVIENPDKAKACFGPRENVSWIYSPSKELEEISPVAKWLNRTTFEEFFESLSKKAGFENANLVFLLNETPYPPHYFDKKTGFFEELKEEK